MLMTDVKKPLVAVVRLRFRDANPGRVFLRDGPIMLAAAAVRQQPIAQKVDAAHL